jgi:precorrin-2 dehydrogenase / sirohydrochlorin ferrochelatase
MPYYPVNLDLRGKRCLVVGGGEVAERKIGSLLACGADVTVVSPDVTGGIRTEVENQKVEYRAKEFSPDDLEGVFLCIAATDDREVNTLVSRLAQESGILVNVVDDPDLCSFIVPAVVNRGDLQISISTSGKSPALAKRIRRDLENQFGPECAVYLEILGEAREAARAKYGSQKEREAALNRLLDSDILELLSDGDIEKARARARECI